jgi:hypothetical protein
VDEDRLNKVVCQLVEHPEALRMYKLLYWTQLHHWENDEAVLKRYPLDALLEGITSQVQSADALAQLLTQAATKLTKPAQYQAIAQTIANLAAPLYSNTAVQSYSQGVEVEEQFQEVPALATLNQVQAVEPPQPAEVFTLGQGTLPDIYDLRCHLMRDVPPLKAKILLFSVLRHPFTFSRTDWWELKRLTLDEWLQELLQQFSAIADLDMTLMQQAETLPELDQGVQVAIAISKSIRLKYSDMSGLIFP